MPSNYKRGQIEIAAAQSEGDVACGWDGATVRVTMIVKYADQGTIVNAWQVDPMDPETPAWVRDKYLAWKKENPAP
jgi:hypothetical protein